MPNPIDWIDPFGLTSKEVGCPGKCVFTHRGDTRDETVIFAAGFEPKGANTDLFDYAKNNIPSVYVSTSKSPDVAGQFATQFGTTDGFVYAMKPSNGIDVNEVLGSRSPFPDELEVAVPGGFKPDEILGATPINADGSFVGHSILNPAVYGGP